MNGTQLIKRERQRQIREEHWTRKHDDTQHTGGQLKLAGECYLRCAKFQIVSGTFSKEAMDAFQMEPKAWPWEPHWFKLGHTAIRTLVKAGALFAAEIERIERRRNRLIGRKFFGTTPQDDQSYHDSTKGLKECVHLIDSLLP